MIKSSIWKIVSALFLFSVVELIFADYILGVPADKRGNIDIAGFLELQLVIICIATVTTLIFSLIWSSDLSYGKTFKFLFPRILAIWICLFMIVAFGGAYYVATVKYGLQVW